MSERAAGPPRPRTERGSMLRSFLDSLRRTPAVPGAVGDELATELLPLLALLDGIEHEAQAARSAAALRLHAERDAALDEVEAILAPAHGQADSERDEVVKAASRAADLEVRRIADEAARAAERIRELGEERRSALADEVVRRVLAFPEARP